VVNISGPSLTTNIPVGPNPIALTGTSDGSRVFVANQGNGTVSVIDTAANALVPSSTSLPNPITVGASPSFLAIKPDNSRVYAVNSVSNSVSVIDTSSNSVTNVPVGANPTHAFYEAGRNRLWVTNSGSNTVTVINALDLTDVRTVSLVDTSATPCANPTPVAVTVLADGTRAYVASKGCDGVSVVNASSLTLSKTIKLGAGAAPVSIASDSPSAKVVAANSGTCQLTSSTVGNCASVIQTSDDSIAAQIATPAPNRFVLITP
jgi:YVTN family beta-propeller protein